jgi:hypothetical protein
MEYEPINLLHYVVPSFNPLGNITKVNEIKVVLIAVSSESYRMKLDYLHP